MTPTQTCRDPGTPPIVSAGQFQLKFLTPAINVCAGCRGGYSRAADVKSPPTLPYDLVLVRKEQHLYYNVVLGRQQCSSTMNVHYHANAVCPRFRCPTFDSSKIEIPSDVRARLLSEHWLFLIDSFGLHA